MGSVPINPSSIANAVPYAVTQSPVSLPISEKPVNPVNGKPQDFVRSVPMQFTWGSATCYQVSLNNVTPHVPLKQIASMYIDNTFSLHDVTILFPDTGWATRIAFGSTAMVTPLTQKANPMFYVILDSDNEVQPDDLTNIFVNDTYIPPSNTSIYQRSIAYGYSEYFELQPTFTQSSAFVIDQAFAGANEPITIINASQWFITMIDLSFEATTSATASGTISLQDNGTSIFNGNFEFTGSGNSMIKIASLSNLNLVSSGKGPLTININNLNNITSNAMLANIFGGVLVN